MTPRCSSSGITSESTSAPPARYSLMCATASPTGGSSRICEVAVGIEVLEHGDVGDGDRRRRPRPGRRAGTRRASAGTGSTPASSPSASTNASCRSSTQSRASAAELGLERGGVDVGHAVGRVDDDVEARHHRLGDEHGEVGVAHRRTRVAQRVDHQHAHRRRVPVARQVHEARHEAARLGRGSRRAARGGAAPCRRSPARASASSSVREPEQLVARVGRQHVGERCARRGSSGAEPRPRQHLRDLAAHDGDRTRRCRCRRWRCRGRGGAARHRSVPSAWSTRTVTESRGTSRCTVERSPRAW